MSEDKKWKEFYQFWMWIFVIACFILISNMLINEVKSSSVIDELNPRWIIIDTKTVIDKNEIVALKEMDSGLLNIILRHNNNLYPDDQTTLDDVIKLLKIYK